MSAPIDFAISAKTSCIHGDSNPGFHNSKTAQPKPIWVSRKLKWVVLYILELSLAVAFIVPARFFFHVATVFFFSSVNHPMSCPKGQLSCPFRISYASIFFKKVLKVSYSRKKILVSSIFSKNELENVNFCPSLLGQKFFVRFLGEKVLSKLTDL